MRLETDLKEDQLADLLSKRDIKIRSIENVNLNEETSDTKKLEKPADKNEFVIITERVREKDFKKAIEELEKTSNSITVIRIEEDI